MGLETPAPVGWHAALLGAEHLEDLFELVTTDDVPDANLFGVVQRHQQREIAIRKAENEILSLFTHHFSFFHTFDDRCAVVRVNYLVTYAKQSLPPFMNWRRVCAQLPPAPHIPRECGRRSLKDSFSVTSFAPPGKAVTLSGVTDTDGVGKSYPSPPNEPSQPPTSSSRASRNSATACTSSSSWRPAERPTTARWNPSRAHSRSRVPTPGTARTSPARPTSPMATRSCGSGAPVIELARARASARSTAGSSARNPPATRTNTSLFERSMPARCWSTAARTSNRSRSRPCATRRGCGPSLGATRLWISSATARRPSSRHPTAEPGTPV